MKDTGLRRWVRVGLLGSVLWGCASGAEPPLAQPFDFEEASRNVPRPRELWPIVRQHCVPFEFKVLTDEVVTSDTDPARKLRKVTAHFWSQELAGKKWGHPCTILLPADSSLNQTPARKGKVVIIGSPGRDYYPIHVAEYGEPIATRTGYPTLVLSNPGTHADFLPAEKPDAFRVEVGDTALGFPGYVSSLPQKLTDALVLERVSRGPYPKLWSPETQR